MPQDNPPPTHSPAGTAPGAARGVRFGFSAPNRGPLANAADLRTLTRRAEELGFGVVTVSDHIVVPRQVASTYPYSETGEFAWTRDGSTDCMEQFTLLAWLAAATESIGLLTSVVVIPHRNPLFMAKSIATTDQLSGGRVLLGIGAGWMREEFEALNLPDFDARGRVTDEYIAVMKALWGQERASFEGEFIRFHDVAADPKPVQKPHPPIWVGGESPAALRRTVALGDVWYPFGTNPRYRMEDVGAFVQRRDRLFAMAEAAGRAPESIGIAFNCSAHDEQAQTGRNGGRLAFTGAAEQRAADFAQWAEAGVTTFMVNVGAGDRNAMLDRMTAFAEGVLPLL